MNPTTTIKITRKDADGNLEQIDVKMLYCAATEVEYQKESKKTVDVFVPVIDKDEEGKPYIKEPPKATDEDYLMLSMAAIRAAYECNDEQPPVTKKDIRFNATREEVMTMIATVIKMRHEWVFLPETIEKETDESKVKKGGKRKNG